MNKIKYAITAIFGVAAGYLLYMKIHLEMIQGITERRMRDYHDLRVMEKLIEYIQDNHDMNRFFEDNQYHSIGVYGMGIVGTAFYRELERRNISVEFIVDIHNNAISSGCKLLRESENWPEVDVVVITDDFYFDWYYKKLVQRVSGAVISIVDILYYVGV